VRGDCGGTGAGAEFSTAEAHLLAVHDEEREREAATARNALRVPGLLHAVTLASRDLAAALQKTGPALSIRRSKKSGATSAYSAI